MSIEREEWRAVPGYEGLYEVSSIGRARSHHKRGRMLSTAGRDETGYPVISLTRNGERKTFTLHRLVCRAFHGESRPVHREVAHLDGNPTNCHADNLKWVSKVENESHKRLHGTRLVGEAVPGAKITADQAHLVKSLVALGTGVTESARLAGVSYRTARDIAEGKRWKHVPIATAANARGARG